ncbi:hypothetical protein BLA50215_05235 [Burkholderia lata]|nr:hypothetical protein BLA50215_05235 [Burkholderia lata]
MAGIGIEQSLALLESLTQVINEARADNSGNQGKQSDMNIEAILETNAKFSETGEIRLPRPFFAFRSFKHFF